MKKPIYNYNLEQCNKLFKKGVRPIGIGRNDKTRKYIVLEQRINILICYQQYFMKKCTGKFTELLSCRFKPTIYSVFFYKVVVIPTS